MSVWPAPPLASRAVRLADGLAWSIALDRHRYPATATATATPRQINAVPHAMRGLLSSADQHPTPGTALSNVRYHHTNTVYVLYI